MTGHRDSPEIANEPASEGGGDSLPPTRRFAGLAGLRRGAVPRLVVATASLLILAVLVGLAGWRGVVSWVDSRPDYQLAFSEIELDPPPESWFVGGSAQILEKVRTESNYGKTISLLDLNLDQVADHFRLCAWVKSVNRVERSYRHLTIHLTYRKPVAVVVLGKSPPVAYPIDDEGVSLLHSDIDFTAKEYPFQVRGFAEPMVVIRGVTSANPPRVGVLWDDPMVVQAARLAEFLQRQSRSVSKRLGFADFVSIHVPDSPDHGFLIMDRQGNRVSWGKAPGEESLNEPSSDARWKMLLDWVDRHGPLDAKAPDYLFFTRTEAVHTRRPPPLKK